MARTSRIQYPFVQLNRFKDATVMNLCKAEHSHTQSETANNQTRITTQILIVRALMSKRHAALNIVRTRNTEYLVPSCIEN